MKKRHIHLGWFCLYVFVASLWMFPTTEAVQIDGETELRWGLNRRTNPSLEEQKYVLVRDFPEQQKNSTKFKPLQHEWHIKIPRAYIIGTHRFDNEGRAGMPSEGQSLFVSVLADPKTYDFQPQIGAKTADKKSHDRISITLSNKYGGQNSSNNGLCNALRQPNTSLLRRKHGGSFACYFREGQINRCNIFTTYQGWQVKFNLPSGEFQPGSTAFNQRCTKIEEFVDGITTKIDETSRLRKR